MRERSPHCAQYLNRALASVSVTPMLGEEAQDVGVPSGFGQRRSCVARGDDLGPRAVSQQQQDDVLQPQFSRTVKTRKAATIRDIRVRAMLEQPAHGLVILGLDGDLERGRANAISHINREPPSDEPSQRVKTTRLRRPMDSARAVPGPHVDRNASIKLLLRRAQIAAGDAMCSNESLRSGLSGEGAVKRYGVAN